MSSSYEHKLPLKQDCPTEKALSVLSGKWKPAILSQLFKKNLRLTEIQKGLPEASRRALTKQLAEMQQDGIVQKEDFNEFPKRTEYSLTPLGKELQSVFRALSDYGKKL
ncbi:winged helix-turn-helix transcriptional regulator [Salinimicrobium soli]|uniref:winged helix-turn-helix transcriptional regulator n=1 Tax=Salinimicrobium soli TaxID=1254399 RepID=UPI003AAA2D7D